MKKSFELLRALIREEVIDARHRFGKKKQTPTQNNVSPYDFEIEQPKQRHVRGLPKLTGKPVKAYIVQNENYETELIINNKVLVSSNDTFEAVDFLVECMKVMREHGVTEVVDDVYMKMSETAFQDWFDAAKTDWKLTPEELNRVP